MNRFFSNEIKNVGHIEFKDLMKNERLLTEVSDKILSTVYRKH